MIDCVVQVTDDFWHFPGGRSRLKSRSKPTVEPVTEEAKNTASSESLASKPKSERSKQFLQCRFCRWHNICSTIDQYNFVRYIKKKTKQNKLDRFSRPTYGARSRPTTTTTPAPIEDETAVKAKPKSSLSSSPSLSARGRSYYYFFFTFKFSFVDCLLLLSIALTYDFDSHLTPLLSIQHVIDWIWNRRHRQRQHCLKKRPPMRIQLIQHLKYHHQRNEQHARAPHSIYADVHVRPYQVQVCH